MIYTKTPNKSCIFSILTSERNIVWAQKIRIKYFLCRYWAYQIFTLLYDLCTMFGAVSMLSAGMFRQSTLYFILNQNINSLLRIFRLYVGILYDMMFLIFDIYVIIEKSNKKFDFIYFWSSFTSESILTYFIV